MPSAIHAQNPIDVFESTLKVAALGEEEFYYGFAEGDQIVFNFEEVNDKELKEVEIIEYPSSSKFMDYKTKKIDNKILSVSKTGVYKFVFRNSALSGRVCKFKIQRIPQSEKTKNFNTAVYWETLFDTTYTVSQEKYLISKKYKTVAIGKEKHYINSGSNAALKGGQSRIYVPVSLPPNTVLWAYRFLASRNAKDIDRIHNSMSLVGDASKAIDQTGVLDAAINQLTAPPGGNACNVFLLDGDNATLFEAKSPFKYYQEGSRNNLSSGVVKVKPTNIPQYIGIQNPDGFYGISVSLEIIAITYNEQWGTRNVSTPNITSHKRAYLKA